MNAAKYILDNAAEPGRTALLHDHMKVPFSQVGEGAIACASLLVERGYAKGDRVLIIDDSSFFWVSAYLGSLLAGAVAVPIPTNTDGDKLTRLLHSCSPKGAFVSRKYLAKYRKTLHCLDAIDEKALLADDPDRRRLEGRDDRGRIDLPAIDDRKDIAALMYTSGSTGEPRGVMVTHRNIIANTESIIEYLSLTSDDRIMAILPFYYCFGTSLLHTHLKVGGAIVIQNSFLFPEKVLNSMEETKCTGLAGVPSTFQILLRNSTFKKRQLADLRYVQQAGGKLPTSFISELVDALPGREVFVMYGQTEATARLSYLQPDRLIDKLGSIGKGIPGVTLEVLDKDGKPVKPNEIGEIVASGDNIAAGYWDSPEETSKSFRDGKLFTGDLATVDEDGFIFVVDREKDFIKCAGHRVSSKELEEVVVKMEGIIEATVVPQPDEKLGEAVCLFVTHVLGEKALAEIESYCKRHIKWPLTPKKIICLRSMPKNSSGKLDKAKLKKMVSSGNVEDSFK